MASSMPAVVPVLIVHGGAGPIVEISQTRVDSKLSGVKDAGKAGYKVLCEGGSALDAVQAAVMVMEKNPEFNAGRGSRPTVLGDVEMDAMIMDGSSLQVGSVACVKNIQHPIELARMVMDKTDHCMLVGVGANLFARQMGFPLVPTEELVREEHRKDAREYTKYHDAVTELLHTGKDDSHDTVGAVALDAQGNVAFATSTGGIRSQLPGRVGDSPLVGCGGYADNDIGAVTCTGHGESFMKCTIPTRILNKMEQGVSVADATDEALTYMKRRVNGTGGCIVIGRDGQTAVKCTDNRMMPWAIFQGDKVKFGMNQGDKFEGTCISQV
ncbi:isoaspartyl peptidase/L-asparaginase-like [Branchiostoma floridae x Branchiostoma japonicum]